MERTIMQMTCSYNLVCNSGGLKPQQCVALVNVKAPRCVAPPTKFASSYNHWTGLEWSGLLDFL